jgi:crotonobetainyl-CoA:carnitine CoA-transferase CaiB-like acyl-CoA transferase
MVHLPASPPHVAPVPAIGQHSRALLRELGVSVEDIEALVASAVVKCGALPEKEPA